MTEKELIAARYTNLALAGASPGVKVKNAAQAAGRVVKSILGNKPIMVSDEEQERRMAICAMCEFYIGSTCKKCGCHIRFKAKLQTEHCPIGKW